MMLSARFRCLSLSVLSLFATFASSACADNTFVEKASETLGATLVAHCVSSHLNLDLICTSVAEDEMETERATKLVDLTIQLIDQVGPRVEQLTKTEGCDEEDRKILEIIAKSYDAIEAEAKALQKYITSEEAADLEAFKTASTAAQEQMDAIGK